MANNLKYRIYQIIEKAEKGDVLSLTFDIFISSLIFLNVIAVILESEKYIYTNAKAFFDAFEYFSIAVFTIEYILRLWTCTEINHYKKPVFGRIKYAMKPIIIIDALTFIPFYIPFIIPIDLRFIRVIRLLRIVRVFKISRYSDSLMIMGRVIKNTKTELLITMFVLFILLIIASSLVYLAEREVQPNSFSSIPAAMWWAVATLTTVGYGDLCPVTVLGKILASIVSILGIGLFALPAGILGGGFVKEIQLKKKVKTKCPHCGKVIE